MCLKERKVSKWYIAIFCVNVYLHGWVLQVPLSY